MGLFNTTRRETFGELPVDLISSVQTSATGTTYVPLTSVTAARMVRFMNPSVDLQVRRGASGDTITAKANKETLIYVSSDASELQVRRADVSGTQVTTELLVGVY